MLAPVAQRPLCLVLWRQGHGSGAALASSSFRMWPRWLCLSWGCSTDIAPVAWKTHFADCPCKGWPPRLVATTAQPNLEGP